MSAGLDRIGTVHFAFKVSNIAVRSSWIALGLTETLHQSMYFAAALV